MEDFKPLIYLALSIIYFIYKGLNKKDKKNSKPINKESSESRPRSFEDILAEITGTNPPTIEKDRGYAEDEIEERALLETASERPLNQTVSASDYENADDTLKELYKKGEKLKTINELVDINEVETSSHFKAYSTEGDENNLAQEIREDFQNPDTVKKAFIYGEIFNRKY